MSSFRRLALLLALALVGTHFIQAQSSSSSSSAPAAPAQPAANEPNSGQLSVQARIRARREQRRVAAIREVYTHLYEAYGGMGYMRFTPGASLQRLNEYSWNAGFTRYFDERLGVTLDGRGNYGSAFIEPKAGNQNITKPAISQYSAMAGPTYRFYLQPRYSISGRVMAGMSYGNFSGDTGHNQALATYLGLYPDGYTYAANVGIVGEYNVSPNIGVRLVPDYTLTGYGSSTQNNLGFTLGVVYRFGKQ